MNFQDAPNPAHELPELCAHDELENEWWYYHGHLSSGERKFGFHLVFFRRRTDLVRVGTFFKLRHWNEQIRFAHFAITDFDRGQFLFSQRRAFDRHAGAESNRYRVWHQDWSITGCELGHKLVANAGDIELDLLVRTSKPLTKHGDGGQVSELGNSQSFYVSYPRMSAEGRLTVGGETLSVGGTAWMDHEYGTMNFHSAYHGWDWFAFQLDDGREVLIYRIRNREGRQLPQTRAVLVGVEGSTRVSTGDHVQIQPLEFWNSPSTGNTYPVKWEIVLSELGFEFQVESCFRSHEIDTRGSTCVIYWEGPGNFVGRDNQCKISGRCFIELSGYDQKQNRIGIYDFGKQNLGIADCLFNEFRWCLSRGKPKILVLK